MSKNSVGFVGWLALWLAGTDLQRRPARRARRRPQANRSSPIPTIFARCTCRSSAAGRAASPGRRIRRNSSTPWPVRCGAAENRRRRCAAAHGGLIRPISRIGRRTAAGWFTAPIATTRVELWMLDLTQGSARVLLANGAVNVEPRFSPDGKRIVFVSTQYNKRFHIFTADVGEGNLSGAQRLTGEHRSELPRYYYSAFDHEINPVWTRDGRDIIYVSNRGHLYGTGGFWRRPSRASAGEDVAAAAAAREIITRKRTGRRVPMCRRTVRAWCSAPIWAAPGTTSGSCRPRAAMPSRLPMGIGIRPIRAGRRMARGWPSFPTRAATPQIGIVAVPGGLVQMLPIAERQYSLPMARLHIDIRDAKGAAASARRRRHRCRRPFLRAGGRVDQRRRFLRPPRAAQRSPLFPCRRRDLGWTCRPAP